MAKMSVKHKIGDRVYHFSGVRGMVTAIFIRGKSRAYEFSFCDSNGIPTCVTAEEVELNSDIPKKVGFGK